MAVSADVSARLKDIFKQFDADETGTIAREDLRRVLQALTSFTPEVLDKLIGTLRSNENGRVHFDQFLQWLTWPVDGGKETSTQVSGKEATDAADWNDAGQSLVQPSCWTLIEFYSRHAELPNRDAPLVNEVLTELGYPAASSHDISLVVADIQALGALSFVDGLPRSTPLRQRAAMARFARHVEKAIVQTESERFTTRITHFTKVATTSTVTSGEALCQVCARLPASVPLPVAAPPPALARAEPQERSVGTHDGPLETIHMRDLQSYISKLPNTEGGKGTINQSAEDLKDIISKQGQWLKSPSHLEKTKSDSTTGQETERTESTAAGDEDDKPLEKIPMRELANLAGNTAKPPVVVHSAPASPKAQCEVEDGFIPCSPKLGSRRPSKACSFSNPCSPKASEFVGSSDMAKLSAAEEHHMSVQDLADLGDGPNSPKLVPSTRRRKPATEGKQDDFGLQEPSLTRAESGPASTGLGLKLPQEKELAAWNVANSDSTMPNRLLHQRAKMNLSVNCSRKAAVVDPVQRVA
eukprot:TRINITY_DN12740_c0_g1_i3.p1 TRINITY_DN12740_c0_g1~~TRINITY_DN12740_c0_g1_i3.p1  ORF type:complete len:558 (+),score=101.76 TRINITY_DN12740_c0_g1_i3:94-1674(+)